MATKKIEQRIVRATLNKALKERFPDLFKKAKGGPRISAAALAVLSPTLRASVLNELKKAQGEGEAPYEAKDVGAFVIAFLKK